MAILDSLRRRPAGQSATLDRLDSTTPADSGQAPITEAGEFNKGLRRFGHNAGVTARGFAAGMAEPYAPAWADEQFAIAERTSREQPADWQAKVDSFRDVDSVESAVDYGAGVLGEGLGSIGTMLAAGLITRGAAFKLSSAAKNAAQFAGGASAMLPMEGGETAMSLRQNPEAMANTTAEERRNLTLGRGAVNAALESVVPSAVFASTIAGGAGRIAAGGAPALANIARKAAGASVGEFATEGAQELTGQYAENVAVPGTGYDTERALEAGVRGAISGGVLGGAGGTVQAARSNIDAAAETALEQGRPAATDALNRAVEGIDNLIRNPEEVGADLTSTTLGAMAEGAARAREMGAEAADAAGPAAASGMDTIAAIRMKFDRAVVGQLTPENKQKYAQLADSLRLLEPTEYERLRDAFDTGDSTTINQAIGDVAAQLQERVPRGTFEGIRNIAAWGKKFGAGVTKAAREGRKAAQKYSKEDVNAFARYLDENQSAVANTLINSQENPEQVLRALMAARYSKLTPKDLDVLQPALAAVGADVSTFFEDIRAAGGTVSRPRQTISQLGVEEEQQAWGNKDSNAGVIAESAKTFMTDDVRAQFDELDIPAGPGVTFADDGEVYDANGNVMDPEDPTNTPFSSRELVQRIQSVDTLNGSPSRRSPRFNIPVTYKSADGRATPEQIIRLLGSKDLVDGKEVRRDATDEEVAARVKDGTAVGYISPVALAANTGKEANEGNPEQGGFKEVFSRFVPDFDPTANNRNVSIQGYRLLSALASLNSDGIELAPDQIPEGMWKELGITKDSEPLKITASLEEGGLDLNTVVQRKYRNNKRRDITMGDLLGANRGKRRLDAQKALLEDIATNPEETNPSRALNQLVDEDNPTAEAALKGLKSFARDNKLSPNAAVPGYLQQLEQRINDSSRKQRFSDARKALKRAYSAELITEGQMEELAAYKDQDGEQKSAELDELAVYLQTNLEVDWKTDAELVEMLDDFLADGIWEVDTARDEFEQNAIQEPTEDDRFEAAMKSPEGGETRRMKAGIDQQNDAAERDAREEAQRKFIRQGQQQDQAQKDADDADIAAGEATDRQRDVDTETAGQARIRKAKEKAGLKTPPKPKQATQPDETQEGDGTLVRAKGKVADREKFTPAGTDIEVTIAGEFVLHGETFVVHRDTNNLNRWAVSHKATGRGVGTRGRKSIATAHEDSIELLKKFGPEAIQKAIAESAPRTETKPATETKRQKIERIQAERKAEQKKRSVVKKTETETKPATETAGQARIRKAREKAGIKTETKPATETAQQRIERKQAALKAQRAQEKTETKPPAKEKKKLGPTGKRATAFEQIKATKTEAELDKVWEGLLAEQSKSKGTTEEFDQLSQMYDAQLGAIESAGADRFKAAMKDGTAAISPTNIRQTAVNNWTKKYLPAGSQTKVIYFDPTNDDQRYFLKQKRGQGRLPLGTAYSGTIANLTDDGTNYIFVTDGDKLTHMSILAHEFGHLVQYEAHYADKAGWEAVNDLYLKELNKDFTKAMSATRLFEGSKDLVDAVDAGTMTAEQAIDTAKLRKAESLGTDVADALYQTSFSEWFAENFAKYAISNTGVFAQADKGVKAHLDAIIAKMKNFYNEVIKKNFTPDQSFTDYLETLAARREELAADPDRRNNIFARDNREAARAMARKLDAESRVAAGPSETGADERNPPPEGTTEPPPPVDPPQEPPNEPPNEPPQEPPQPKKPPPPPPDAAARAKFLATVKRLLGNRVNVEWEAKLPEGLAAEYESAHGQPIEDTKAALKDIRERRARALAEAKRVEALLKDPNNKIPIDEMADPVALREEARALEAEEQQYLNDAAVRGTIRVAAGMEAQAGLAEHESFHAAFEIFFGQDNAADRKAVTTAFTRGVLAKRLQKYFAGNEEVLAVIDPASPDFNAEEAAAYAFQVHLHDPGALQMGQKVEGIFNKFLQYLQKLLGYKTYEQKARMVFNDLNSGQRAERRISVLRDNPSVEKSMLTRSQDFVRGVGTSFMHMYDTVLSSSYDRLEASGNVAMAQIARLGYNETGQDGTGMIQRQRHEVTKWSNRLKEALHTLNEEELSQLNTAMMLGEELTGKMGEAQKRLRTILADVHRYQTDAGVDLGFQEGYFPMIWNPEKVSADPAGFLDMLNKPEYAEAMRESLRTADDIFEAIASYEERGHEFQGIFGKDGEPVADSSRRRSLSFIENADRVAYMEDDLTTTMGHYLNQSVRHTEYVRAYGQNGAKMKSLLGEITSTYGGTQTDVDLAKDYINGLMGNKEVGMSRELKDLYGAATVYQNVRLLPLSVFSSLVDPLGVAVRTQSMGSAFDTFAYSVRNMFTDFRDNWTPDQWTQYAADMGTIDMSGTVKSIDKIYTGVTLRGKTQEINDGFFKWNLLNGWVKNNHIMATKAAQLYLRRNAEGEMFTGEMRDQNLKEAGVSAEDIVYDEGLGRIKSTAPELLGYENAEQMELQATEDEIKGAREQADRIQQAIHKIVRQSMIQPSSAEMPGWMSNPYLAPIAHLKTFVFGFNATILQRLLYEAKRGNYNPIYYAAAYVPGMIAADFVKGFAGNGGEEPEWKKNWGVSDYLGYGVERSGLLGTGQFFADMNNDVTRGGGGFESLAGPSIEQATDLMGAMNAKTSRPTATWMTNALPANALYDQWLNY